MPESHAPTLAVIGGGQLARMMAQPAIALGLPLRLLAEAEGVSAAQVVVDQLVGDYRDLPTLRRVTDGCPVVTFDHEHVPTEHLHALEADGVAVRPGPDALVHAQDKAVMRQRLAELGIPCPRNAVVADVEQELGGARSEDELRRSIAGRWVEGTVLVEISVDDRDPEVAAQIANLTYGALTRNDPSRGGLRYTLSNPANPPVTYSSPNLLFAILVGTMVSLVLGAAAALARDRRTFRITTAADLEAGYPHAGGNFDADPQFVDAEGPDGDPFATQDNDFHLRADSPCIDGASIHVMARLPSARLAIARKKVPTNSTRAAEC